MFPPRATWIGRPRITTPSSRNCWSISVRIFAAFVLIALYLLIFSLADTIRRNADRVGGAPR